MAFIKMQPSDQSKFLIPVANASTGSIELQPALVRLTIKLSTELNKKKPMSEAFMHLHYCLHKAPGT